MIQSQLSFRSCCCDISSQNFHYNSLDFSACSCMPPHFPPPISVAASFMKPQLLLPDGTFSSSDLLYWRFYSKSPTCEPSSCKLSKDVNMHLVPARNLKLCHQHQAWVKLHLSYFIPYCWRSFSSTISHLLSLLQSVTLLVCSLSTSLCRPAVVLATILFKVLCCKI